MLRPIRNLATSFLLLPVFVGAHEPITTKLTWTQEISRIVYKHCASCHHEGGAAPMSLKRAAARGSRGVNANRS